MSGPFTEESKKGWFCGGTNERPSTEHLKLGCLQRIAEAVEKMSGSYAELIADRDYYKKRFDEERACARRLVKSNSALRGWVKRRGKKK